MDGWEDLPAFRAVAEELSFSRAGARLGTTGSRVSQRVRRLERRLGVTLFVRTTRRVSLTPAGRRLLVAADEVAASLDAAEADLAALAPGGVPVRVRLRLGLQSIGAARVRAFLARPAPGILTSLVPCRDPGEAVAAVLAGDLDAVLACCAYGPEPWPGGVDADLVVQEHLHVTLPRRHPLARRSEVALRDLATQAWVGFPPEEGWARRRSEALCAAHGFTPVYGAPSFDEDDQRALVAQGDLVELHPPLFRPSPDIVLRPLAGPVESTIVLVSAVGHLADDVRADLLRAARRWYVDGLVKFRSPWLEAMRGPEAHPSLRADLAEHPDADGTGQVD